MNFELNEEQRMLQDTLRRMLSENNEGEWSLLAEQGVFAALFSEDVGGLGGSGFDLSIVFEELGRAGSIEPVLDSVLMCGRLIEALAGETHRDLLQRVINGNVQLALAHSEPASRYDLNRVALRADNHLLNGRKSLVFNANAAEYLLVTARFEGQVSDREGLALYLLPTDTLGVTILSYEVTGGGHASDVVFDNVQLSADHCLSSNALDAIEQTVAAASVALCAETLGAMETAVALTCEYLGTRQQFGRPLATFQALSHRVADMTIELEQARSAVTLAAGHLHDSIDARDLHISAAKNLMGRTGKLIAEEAIQLHGGIGLTAEYQLGHFAKKIIMADHRFGDTDYHLERFINLSSR